MSGYDSAYSGDYIPHKLRTLVNRMENYRVNHLKLQTESQTSASSSERIVVNMPSSGLVNLASFTMSGKYKGTTATGTLPHCGIAGLIQRLDVTIGGQVIDSISNYGQLYQLLKNYTDSPAHNRQVALGQGIAASGTQQGGGELAAPMVNGTYGVIDDTSTATVKSSQEAINQASARFMQNVSVAAAAELPFNYSNWLGLLGKDCYLQLETLPAPIQVVITLDSKKCLGGAGTADFELNSLYFKIDAVEFPKLTNSLAAVLSANQPVPIPFTRWVNFNFSNSAGAVIANRFSIATQCLSKIWVNAVKQTNYAQAAAADARNNLQFVSDCDSSTDWYLEVDNRRTSQYNIDQEVEGYDWIQNELGVKGDLDYDNLLSGMGEFSTATNTDGNKADYGTNNFFNSAWAVVFNLGFNDYDHDDYNNISGINTAGLSSSVVINALKGYQSADHQTNVFAETKAILNVMPNRVISVDY
jgi:hypothetical protein